jgi:hypothetical protein
MLRFLIGAFLLKNKFQLLGYKSFAHKTVKYKRSMTSASIKQII